MDINLNFLKKIEIVSATAHHFKGFEDDVSIEFSRFTEIFGDNSRGKSSVADLIAFVFNGTNSFGEKVDFLNQGKYFGWASIKFIGADNIVREIKRELSRDKNNGKTTTTIRIDHKTISTAAFNREINSDLFLSMLNPKYFQSLSPAKAKNVLFGLVNIKRDKVEELMDEDSKEAIKSSVFTIYDLDSKRSKISKEIKILEKTGSELRAKLKYLKDLTVPEEIVFDEDDFCNTIKSLAYDNSKTNIDKLLELLKERDDALRNNMKREVYLKEQISSEEDKEICSMEIEKINNEVAKLKKEYSALDLFKSKHLQLVVDSISSLLDKVSIQLSEKGTDGKEKEVFNILYNGKNTNICSCSEQIKTGLEVYSMLSELSRLQYPLIIDNAEAITTLDNMVKDFTQVITMTVMKGRDLCFAQGDVLVDVKTRKTMPRMEESEMSVNRILGDLF